MKVRKTTTLLRNLDIQHFRLLYIIYSHPDGLSARRLVEELKMRGWCDPETTAEDLGLQPDDIMRRPRTAANDR